MNFPDFFAACSRLGLSATLVFGACFASAAERAGADSGGAVQPPDAALKAFKMEEGIRAELFAGEPLLANPVAFATDEKGRWYIAETYRQEHGVEDNRGHANWLDADIAARTTADRLAMIRKFYPDATAFADEFTKFEDRVVRIEDTNGDGRPDRQTILADGFRDPLDGTGAGILVRGTEAWWTCIPNLWRFTDADGDGKAEAREKLLEGFGVKFAFRGHDMHGLRFGPDGRLYFSIGDRGIHVKTKEGGEAAFPDTGAVMRCNSDGTGFEVFATGLRNPQELAFDEYGNLFTGDNNSDSGDKARFVHVVEGADSGWRMTFQYLSDRGPWNRELLWDEKEAPKARAIVPPIANLGNGPSGLTYNPGTGLGPKYQGCFFLSDFRGGASNSVVHVIRLEPNGAGFKLKEARPFLRGVLSTDCEFGNDGGFYVLDWVAGWSGNGRGRIYRLTDASANQAKQAETARLLAEGMESRPVDAQLQLLSHEDQRVRQAAQFALAGRGALDGLVKVAREKNAPRLARVHALWGIGQICAKNKAAQVPWTDWMKDADPEIRAQAAKAAGEAGPSSPSSPALVSLLVDESARVRFFAGLSLGKLRHAPAVPRLFEALAANRDADPVLRHGLVMGLAGAAGTAELVARAGDPSPAVRAGAVLALKRQRNPEIAVFFKDADEAVVLEAARAVYDDSIEGALQALAGLTQDVRLKNPRILERAANARYRLGGGEHARALAEFAAREAVPAASRREAIELLGLWKDPGPKDRLLNLWRPIPARPATDAVAAVGAVVPKLLKDAAVQESAARMVARLGINAGEALEGLAGDEKAAPAARIAALQTLSALKDPHLAGAAKVAFTAKDAKLRGEALQALVALEPSAAVRLIVDTFEKGELVEKQAAINALSRIKHDGATAEIGRLLDRLREGKLPAPVHLEVLDAARYRPELAEKLNQYETREKTPLWPYSYALEGGNADRGRKVFREKAEVQCLRCHKCEIGDSAVGPELTRIGRSKDRRYLLESIVFPNQMIAAGFSIVSLTLKDGSVMAGRLLAEENGTLTVETADAQGKPQRISVPADQVRERFNAPSPMPENLRDSLSRWELRDLVEYLASMR